jgi:hypothetical protein
VSQKGGFSAVTDTCINKVPGHEKKRGYLVFERRGDFSSNKFFLARRPACQSEAAGRLRNSAASGGLKQTQPSQPILKLMNGLGNLASNKLLFC